MPTYVYCNTWWEQLKKMLSWTHKRAYNQSFRSGGGLFKRAGYLWWWAYYTMREREMWDRVFYAVPPPPADDDHFEY